MLKGLGQIVSWSIKDESLHSEAGCWLFRTFIDENQEIWTDELKSEIYEAARITVQLEDDFIDRAFEQGELPNLSKIDLKNYIRHRANTKLQDLGLKSNWKNIDKESLERMEWFSVISGGVELQDFFAQKVSAYSKGLADFEGIW
jgi:ribonucleoside-diphosphate reductase beta chain